jgi:hypothetical protein
MRGSRASDASLSPFAGFEVARSAVPDPRGFAPRVNQIPGWRDAWNTNASPLPPRVAGESGSNACPCRICFTGETASWWSRSSECITSMFEMEVSGAGELVIRRCINCRQCPETLHPTPLPPLAKGGSAVWLRCSLSFNRGAACCHGGHRFSSTSTGRNADNDYAGGSPAPDALRACSPCRDPRLQMAEPYR